jgi:MYXO-CTERM domain-containing protein
VTSVRAWALVLGVTVPLIGGCGGSDHPIGGSGATGGGAGASGATDGTTSGGGSPEPLRNAGATKPCMETSAARARVAALRDQFRVAAPQPDLDVSGRVVAAPATTRPVIGRSIATSFRHVRADAVRPELPDGAKRALLRSATVELPLRADGAVRLEDDTSQVELTFALRGASSATIETTAGTALYRRALSGADVVHRPSAEGTEDFVVFESRPAREQLEYDVDVSRVAGLRLVENVLEFIDHDGTPVLRMSPPYVVGQDGKVTSARISVDGCAYDVDPAGPWGRAVTAPSASSCRVRVGWQGVFYPAMVDPTWTATGSMTTTRQSHTATLLPSGKVLITGGNIGAVTSAELFDGTSTFAATGSMTTWHEGGTATLLPSGKVLIAGGGAVSSAELFDGTSTFTATGSMTMAHEGGTATLLPSGKVLIAGGYAGVYLPYAELFDGASTFTATGSMTAVRAGHTATLLPSGKVLIAGGQPTGPTSAELFDGTSTFTATGSMTTAQTGCTATLLPSGKVLFAGGGFSGLSNAELFDGTSSFTATGSMTTARAGHTATLLPAGEVLIAGGFQDPTISFSSAELFGTSSFAATVSMTAERFGHTATLLPSGKVLIAGGFDGWTGVPLSSAELFTSGAGGAGDAGVGGSGGSGAGGTAGSGVGGSDSGVGGSDSGVGGSDSGVGGSDSGVGGTAGLGGAADSGLAGTRGNGPGGRSNSSSDSGGCGCHAAGNKRRGDAPWLVIAALGLLAPRRRRR